MKSSGVMVDTRAADQTRQQSFERWREIISREAKARAEAGMAIAEIIPFDRAAAQKVFEKARSEDLSVLNSGRRSRNRQPRRVPPLDGWPYVFRSPPYDLAWQTETPPGASFYGPDTSTGLLGSSVSVDVGQGAKSMGDCVGIVYYAPQDLEVQVWAQIPMHGTGLVSAVFGGAEVLVTTTVQVQEATTGEPVGSDRFLVAHYKVASFQRDDFELDGVSQPWKVLTLLGGHYYQVWASIDVAVSQVGGAYAGIDVAGQVNGIGVVAPT